MRNIIANYNSKGQRHGYQEWYWNGKLYFKRFYQNGVKIDYGEFYYSSGKLEKSFYI